MNCELCGKLIIEDSIKVEVYEYGENELPTCYHIECFYENFVPIDTIGEQ